MGFEPPRGSGSRTVIILIGAVHYVNDSDARQWPRPVAWRGTDSQGRVMHSPAAYSSANGGYSSMSSSRYASIRSIHRITPTPNGQSEAGYDPVKRMANHAITVVTNKPIT